MEDNKKTNNEVQDVKKEEQKAPNKVFSFVKTYAPHWIVSSVLTLGCVMAYGTIQSRKAASQVQALPDTATSGTVTNN